MPSDIKPFSPKRVFFMGAGTSALAGVPTFGNFYETAEDICKNNLADRKKKKLFKDVLKDWHKNFRDYDIEQYYALIEMEEDLGNDPHDSDNIITTGKIRDFIFYTIQQSLQINTTCSYISLMIGTKKYNLH